MNFTFPFNINILTGTMNQELKSENISSRHPSWSLFSKRVFQIMVSSSWAKPKIWWARLESQDLGLIIRMRFRVCLRVCLNFIFLNYFDGLMLKIIFKNKKYYFNIFLNKKYLELKLLPHF